MRARKAQASRPRTVTAAFSPMRARIVRRAIRFIGLAPRDQRVGQLLPRDGWTIRNGAPGGGLLDRHSEVRVRRTSQTNCVASGRGALVHGDVICSCLSTFGREMDACPGSG